MIDYEPHFSRARPRACRSPRSGAWARCSRDAAISSRSPPATRRPRRSRGRRSRRSRASCSRERTNSVLQYGATRGYRPLLEVIAAIMLRRGAPTASDRLIVTTGSQQGLDLVARVLLDPGDVVLVELPTYTGAISAFRNVRAQLAGVPQEADGIDLGALEDVHRRLVRDGRRVRLSVRRAEFPEPDGPAHRTAQAAGPARLGGAARHPHRRGRSVP